LETIREALGFFALHTLREEKGFKGEETFMKVYVPKNCEHCYGRGCVCEEDMNSLPPEFLLSEEDYQQLPSREKENWIIVSTCGCAQD
jgi:hypothetical protein